MAILGAVLSRSWIFVVLACFLLTFAQAFYFELLERDPERCFIEEYYDDEATIRGSYKAIQYDKGDTQNRAGSVHIIVRNPDKVEILSREYKNEGTFAYMTSKSGAYELCFHRIKASDQVTRVYLHYEEKTRVSSKVEDFVEYHEEKTRAERDPEEHEREEQEEEERERKSKGKKSKSKEKEDESEHEKKERLKAEKEEEERERAEDEAREKKENSQHEGEESQHDKDKTKAEKEAEEREHAEDEAREKKEKQEDEHEGEKDEVEDAERKGKKRPLAQRIVSAAEEKYSLVWQMYLRYNKREKVFRRLSKTTNSRVLWWGFLQIVVLAVTAAWQMRHLTKFFILKKIV